MTPPPPPSANNEGRIGSRVPPMPTARPGAPDPERDPRSPLRHTLPTFDGIRELDSSPPRAEARAPDVARRFAQASWEEIEADPTLRAYGAAAGRGAFGQQCAPCHGQDGRGARGFPDLADRDWLWGGSPEAIEQTLRVGIRWPGSEETRSSLMPGFGAQRMLERPQVLEMVELVRALSGQEHDAAAAERARPVFAEQCASCHGEDGRGKDEMGAPNLTDGVWLYGGDRAAIYNTLWNGRGGVMPAFGGRLPDDMIRKLVLHVRGLGGAE